MAKLTRLSAEQRENLVAYLDGELDDGETQRVEQVLAESVVARHDVDMLSRTWDLMSVLPGIKASEEFSRKTLSSIRAAEAPPASLLDPAVAVSLRRAAVLAIGAGVLVAVALAGYQATRRWIPDPAEQLVEEFDLIQNFDNYSEVGDVEFLRILQQNQTLAEQHEPPANK